MRGEVEVWSGDELILKQPNMLVDGAGELIADIMTVSPSLSGMEIDGAVVNTDAATSSILDASNYRIQAISFGTGSGAFQSNAYTLDAEKLQFYTNTLATDILEGSIANPGVLKSPFGYAHNSSYQPADTGFPLSPNPHLTVLEENTSVSAAPVYGGDPLEISSIVPGNGQLTNFLPSGIYSSVFDAYGPTYAALAGGRLGAFPEGSSVIYTTQQSQIYYFKPTGGGFAADRSTSPGSFFNEVSSMDISGFVNMVMSSVPNGGEDGLNFSGGASGLCLSAETENPNQGFPFVEYTVALSEGDAMFAHVYGGITHLGLWSIDMKQSLRNGNTPPFEFDVLNNPRKYKLFCRKGLSKDITYTTNKEQHRDLTIRWRIHFR
jgi:hypothetical protein